MAGPPADDPGPNWISSPRPLGPTWWQSSDGLFYPPEAHPEYVRDTSVYRSVADGSSNCRWMIVAAAVVVLVLIGGWLMATAVAEQGRDSSRERAQRTAEREAATQREIEEALAEMDRASGADQAAIGADGPLDLDASSVVFEDDFTDVPSGWSEGATDIGNTAIYAAGGYDLVTIADPGVLATPPGDSRRQQISIATTATAPAVGASPGWHAVRCQRDESQYVAYDLRLDTAGGWDVREHEVPVGGSEDDDYVGRSLAHGTSTTPLGATPVTIRLVCATLPGTSSTRIAAYVGDELVADEVDDAGELPGKGWEAAVTGGGVGTTVHLTWFEHRDFNP